MTSTLFNLMKTLTWPDFGLPNHNIPQPGPNADALAAKMSAYVPQPICHPEQVPGSSPSEYRLRDNIQVRVLINHQETFRAAWIHQIMTPAQRDLLLNHEQKHYDIIALLARDMFLDLMEVKGRPYPTAQAVLSAAQVVKDYYFGYMPDINDWYDTQTNHGSTASQQTVNQQNAWNDHISRAFTVPRMPHRHSPVGNNAIYKKRLTDVLRDAGLSLVGPPLAIPQ